MDDNTHGTGQNEPKTGGQIRGSTWATPQDNGPTVSWWVPDPNPSDDHAGPPPVEHTTVNPAVASEPATSSSSKGPAIHWTAATAGVAAGLALVAGLTVGAGAVYLANGDDGSARAESADAAAANGAQPDQLDPTQVATQIHPTPGAQSEPQSTDTGVDGGFGAAPGDQLPTDPRGTGDQEGGFQPGGLPPMPGGPFSQAGGVPSHSQSGGS